MKICVATISLNLLWYIATVSTLRCYTCDSSDLDYDEYNKCDTHYNFMPIEECLKNDSEFNSTVEPIDYVCYRSVYFHNDDGYIIMRGCEVRNICSYIEMESIKLNNREMAIPTECQICDTDLCDPLESAIEDK
uniref:Putative conserved secreted protein n=1 Tax=Lutzomyia longipalpis TaxID=7200 RepID=A0A7G3AGE1_LUTLO